MKIEINANNILDNLISEIEEIHTFHTKVPKGAYIGDKGEFRDLYEYKRDAEQRFNLASELLNININALCQAVLTARRWYSRTQYQRCLPEETANKLIKCMIEQNDRDAKYERRGGNDYLLYWNKIISEWARKSREKKTVA